MEYKITKKFKKNSFKWYYNLDFFINFNKFKNVQLIIKPYERETY